MVEILVKFDFHHVANVTEIFSPLLGYVQDFLVFSLTVVGEPAGDLLFCQASEFGEVFFVGSLQVGMLDVIQEPLLEDFRLRPVE